MVKNPKRHLKMILPGGVPNCGPFRHQLLQVTLKCGEMYAFDISAAQHGYYEPVVPWEHYAHHRVKKVRSSAPFGQAQRNKREYIPPTNWGFAINSVNEFWSIKLGGYFILHEARTPVSEMLKLPDQDFCVAQEELLQDLAGYLKYLKKIFQEKGCLYFFKTQIGNVGNALTPSEWSDLCEKMTWRPADI